LKKNQKIKKYIKKVKSLPCVVEQGRVPPRMALLWKRNGHGTSVRI